MRLVVDSRPAASARVTGASGGAFRKPYLVFLGDVEDAVSAKTAFGLRDWIPEDIVGQHRLPECRVDLNLTALSPGDAYERGARSLVIGIAPAGGRLPASWTRSLIAATDVGLDIVGGLHTRLSDQFELVAAATKNGVSIHDIRAPKQTFDVGSGRKRAGKRVLTVGADCAIGKKYAALAITDEMKKEAGTLTSERQARPEFSSPAAAAL